MLTLGKIPMTFEPPYNIDNSVAVTGPATLPPIVGRGRTTLWRTSDKAHGIMYTKLTSQEFHTAFPVLMSGGGAAPHDDFVAAQSNTRASKKIFMKGVRLHIEQWPYYTMKRRQTASDPALYNAFCVPFTVKFWLYWLPKNEFLSGEDIDFTRLLNYESMELPNAMASEQTYINASRFFKLPIDLGPRRYISGPGSAGSFEQYYNNTGIDTRPVEFRPQLIKSWKMHYKFRPKQQSGMIGDEPVRSVFNGNVVPYTEIDAFFVGQPWDQHIITWMSGESLKPDMRDIYIPLNKVIETYATQLPNATRVEYTNGNFMLAYTTSMSVIEATVPANPGLTSNMNRLGVEVSPRWYWYDYVD